MPVTDESIPSPSSGNHGRSLRRYTRRRAPSAERLPLTFMATPLPRKIRRVRSTPNSTTTKLGLLLFGLVVAYMAFVLFVTGSMGDRIETVAQLRTHPSLPTNTSKSKQRIKNAQDPSTDSGDNHNAGEKFRKEISQKASELIQALPQQEQHYPPWQKLLEHKSVDNDSRNGSEMAAPNLVDPQNLFQITEEDILAAAPLNQDLLDDAQHPTPDRILTAFLEPVDYDEWYTTQPLADRSQYTAKAELLTAQSYSRVNSCQKMLQQWPTDDGCPSDGDPYLPWIHDVIPSADGRHVHFVAQNKRRCDTGKNDGPILRFRQGQVALFQHVPIKRVNVTGDQEEPRFQLTTHAEADADAIATRFLCQFSNGDVVPSVFHFDYDWIAFRKRYKGTFHEFDGGIKSIHTSQLIFSCPLPTEWHDTVQIGAHVQNDWTKYFVDLIPIRTPPRFGKSTRFLQPRYRADGVSGDNPGNETFDPIAAWGISHILPRIEDSGRWANIPICLPSLLQYQTGSTVEDSVSLKDDATTAPDPLEVHVQSPTPVRKHRMVSCLWASAGYRTRGERFAINDGQRRLIEWILYHQDVLGFEHVYLYDNSGAFTNETSLKPVADMFPDTVTYIGWPSQICNNRPNNRDSPGERSSQYAAESSCRLRFGPHVDWIGQFDIDEYFVPMGGYTNINQLLDVWEQEDMRILSFASWRAWPRWSKIDPIEKLDDPSLCLDKRPCFDLTVPAKHTFLQTYNCDRFPPGKKRDKMPAEKQIYRPAYVYQHFIHYSAVTALSVLNSTEYQAQGKKYPHRAFPDPRQRFGREESEALMIHSKAVARQDTAGWEDWCQLEALQRPKNQRGLCRLGVPWPEPWPEDPENAEQRATPEGWAYNCYVNPKVEKEFVPRLQKAIEARAPMLGPQE